MQQHTQAVDQHCTSDLRDIQQGCPERVIHQIGYNLPGTDTRRLFNGLLVWGLSMSIVAAVLCWLLFR